MTLKTVFELTEAACELTHKNDRIEKHGEEDRLACDLDFTFETNNDSLAMFHPTLKSSLYMKQKNEGELQLADSNVSKLRMPELNGGKAIHWSGGSLEGAELRFHHGIDEKSHVVFDLAKVGKYKLDCCDGGTVVVHFQAQIYPTTDAQNAFLSKALVNKICTLSVTPPSA